MSYILDALRKSESERQQGRIPDLGQQVQLIHRPRKKTVPVAAWVGLGLILNAAVLAFAFWPEQVQMQRTEVPSEPVAEELVTVAPEPPATSEANPLEEQVPGAETIPPGVTETGRGSITAQEIDLTTGTEVDTATAPAVPEVTSSQPTIIVPSWKSSSSAGSATDVGPASASFGERAPHLVELPMAFQRRIPTLMFNSHLYSSDPAASRVMINDHYLRMGEQFSGIRVEQITVDGVVLSLDGQRFRVGVVRNWTSPR